MPATAFRFFAFRFRREDGTTFEDAAAGVDFDDALDAHGGYSAAEFDGWREVDAAEYDRLYFREA